MDSLAADGKPPLRIAQLAPLWQEIPPRLYGGTERVVSLLTEALVARGHEVTLFAAAGSKTTAKLEIMADETYWSLTGGVPWQGVVRSIDDAKRSPVMLRYLSNAMLADVYRDPSRFDVIHSHLSIPALPFASLGTVPTVSTEHGRLDSPIYQLVLSRLPGANMVSLSNSQREPLVGLPVNWISTVPNAVNIDAMTFREDNDGYLAFLGRISPEKRPDIAIKVAESLGIPLKIAAAIHRMNKSYWDDEIEPLIRNSRTVEYLGELDDHDKGILLAGARALLFPSDWPEPFGLVVPESLACGTPVIALDRGAIRELIIDGEHGFICSDVRAMIEAVGKLDQINPMTCRLHAERFAPDKMAIAYEHVYRKIAAAETEHSP